MARPQVWSISAVTTPPAMTAVSGSPTRSSRQGAAHHAAALARSRPGTGPGRRRAAAMSILSGSGAVLIGDLAHGASRRRVGGSQCRCWAEPSRRPYIADRMIRPQDLLCPKPEGLYCAPGDFYIDPVRPVDRAVITHGHADHARAGHGAVLATPRDPGHHGRALRRGLRRPDAGRRLRRGRRPRRGRGDPGPRRPRAGLGPGGGALEGPDHGGLRRLQAPARPDLPAVRAGRPATSSSPRPPSACRCSATPTTARRSPACCARCAQFPERRHLVGAYALGKAQRIIRLLREAGWDRTIYVHGALERLNALYERARRRPRPAGARHHRRAKAGLRRRRSSSPRPRPSQDRWAAASPIRSTAFASGWMQVRARARQRGVELPLVISDHADWDELTATVDELRPGELWITHGREEALRPLGRAARHHGPRPGPGRLRGRATTESLAAI